MGEASRRKALKREKIRTRSASEIADVKVAYQNLYKSDPFIANMMLMCSELSEYIEIPALTDVAGLEAFIKKNQKRLEAQFVQRFKSLDHNVLEDAKDNALPNLLEICELINKTRVLI